jgi:hypothetical protein
MTSLPTTTSSSIATKCLGALLILSVLAPVVLFAQADAVPTQIGSIDTEPSDVVVLGTSEEGSTSVAAPALPFDTYRREELPTKTVFSDFVIGPGRFELVLAPGESRTVELLVSNRMGDGRIFSFTTEDMEADSTKNDGSVNLLGERTGPYTIKDFISVPYPEFYLEHGERARVPVTISLPADAEPGGFYGSLLTSIISNPNDVEDTSGATPSSVIISRIATLFFVTTPGGIVRDSELIDFRTLNKQSFFTKGPVTFMIESENYGTVHVAASGVLTVKNMLGDDVGSVELEPWFILPGAVRTRQVDWNREFLFGRYEATVQINRGYDNIVDEKTFVFWVFPWKIVLMIFGGLFVFFMIIRFLAARIEFKRKR